MLLIELLTLAVVVGTLASLFLAGYAVHRAYKRFEQRRRRELEAGQDHWRIQSHGPVHAKTLRKRKEIEQWREKPWE